MGQTGPASSATWGTLAAALGGTALAGGLFTAGFAGLCGGEGRCDVSHTQVIALSAAAMGAVALGIGVMVAIRSRTIVTGAAPLSEM